MPPIDSITYMINVLIGVMLVLVIVALVYIISILHKANKLVDKVETTVENVQNFVAKPIKIALQIAEQFHHVLDLVQSKSTSKRSRSKD
ncbi:MAG: hypothetical protein A2V81_02320 [Candidatus Abawacabacteria bacterium RBG_16_42_10]|uniref:Uncharacterized protein n=1 Tax=Candidatus Abawacabacteria bacterium RBG_16_42_10 TaxID=1817814 RepID=A0A1F4XL79_9BACT|nr:MAG: hypothetical protein A2V81_02320 [Candidatus Abawacabacteria bacterium RBG_16_42_10]